MEFVEKLSARIFDSLFECHEDNYDEARFGKPQQTTEGALRESVKRLFRRAGFYRKEDVWNAYNRRKWDKWQPHFSELDWLYQKLEDASSKNLLIDLVAYHIMGARHIRLPLSKPEYWDERRKLRELEEKNGAASIDGGGFELVLQDLQKIGYPLKIYLNSEGALMAFVLEQYACPALGIKARPGDTVIDAGACWGDTALYFAHRVGDAGEVYCFEFVPENLSVLRKNLELNPGLMKRVHVIPSPVWSSTGVKMNHSSTGPGARAIPGQDLADCSPASLSIDDLVRSHHLKRVDLIKMDIEGAEYEALKGASETLKNYKPDLALCVYHSREDFTRLARFVDALGLGYRFSLGHHTIHGEETVIYASARSV